MIQAGLSLTELPIDEISTNMACYVQTCRRCSSDMLFYFGYILKILPIRQRPNALLDSSKSV